MGLTGPSGPSGPTGPIGIYPVRIVNTAGPTDLDNSDRIVFCGATNGAITLNLPAAALNRGLQITIKRTSIGNTNTCRIATAITGFSGTLTATGTPMPSSSKVTVISDGANWQAISIH